MIQGIATMPTAATFVTIRQAVKSDIDALVRLLQQLFEIEADFEFCERRQRRGLEMLIDGQLSWVIVAEVAGKVRAMCSVQLLVSTAEGAMSALVEDMIVHRCWRGIGLGKRLLTSACELAEERGATRVQLLADQENLPALGFYSHMNWNRTQLIALRKMLG